jgi:hypothetical protein
MLTELRQGTPTWSAPDLTAAITLGSRFDAWPRPDATFFDGTSDRSLAVEFKPPGHGKREYVTGLGQCLTYLNAFDYAILVVPALAADGFAIADYLGDTVRGGALRDAPLGVLGYRTDPETDMHEVVPLRTRKDRVAKSPAMRSIFWGYWRDLSQYDVFQLLVFVDRIGDFDAGWQKFWASYLLRGRARLWNGKARRPYSSASASANELNASLSLRHANLIDSNGQLTQQGLELLNLGKVYGADSVVFVDRLARRILDDARHLELIYWVSEVQSTIKPSDLRMADRYLLALEKRLVAEGVIRRPRGHSKPAFIRDEPKLWNKLNLLRRQSTTRYFWPGDGLLFDWRRIIGILAAD